MLNTERWRRGFSVSLVCVPSPNEALSSHTLTVYFNRHRENIQEPLRMLCLEYSKFAFRLSKKRILGLVSVYSVCCHSCWRLETTSLHECLLNWAVVWQVASFFITQTNDFFLHVWPSGLALKVAWHVDLGLIFLWKGTHIGSKLLIQQE